MKNTFKILAVLLSTVISFSCSEKDDDVVDNKPKEIVVTGSAEVHSPTSATLNGFANDANGEIGFCYSATEKNPTPDNAMTIKAASIMSDYSYSVTLTGLSAATTYYYRAYGTKDGLKVLAKDVRSFKTEMVPVTGITVKGSSTSIMAGETLQLSAVVKPDNASDKSITWTSSNTSIATVSTDGLVTAVSAGQVDIKAQANDGSGVVGKVELEVKPFVKLVTSISIIGASARIRVGETLQLSALVYPNDATDTSVTWSSSNTTVSTVTADGLVTAVSAGQVEIKAQANDGSGVVGKVELMVKPIRDTGSHEYVDLGLPSGILWATCNVGANSPEEYGDYFAWGETEPKDWYYWDTYKLCNGSSSTLTKYCYQSKYGRVDNKTKLDPEDDAAHVNWGGSWRMPTKAEQDELHKKCTRTWITLNGVQGWMLYGPNGNSIFLPAAGFRSSGIQGGAGIRGYYWTSTLSTIISFDAYYLRFSYGDFTHYDDRRYYGYSVRAVCE